MIRLDLGAAEVAFTTRIGGVSAAPYDSLNLGAFTDDSAYAVDRNIEAVREALRVRCVHRAHQVHDCEIVEADSRTGTSAIRDDLPEADGLVTGSPGEALLVTGADCPPVVLAGASRVVVLHCGWRPLAAGIVERAVESFGVPVAAAAIGPGICARHYEVGPEVPEAIGPEAADAYSGRRLDLERVILEKLAALGVEKVESIGRCTFCEPEAFFSHRRDGGVTGRQAGVAWLKG